MIDVASSNDVATNAVNGKIGNKTWCKCECCAPMETSIEDVCWLETPEIFKPRFSSTSCLYVCRSDPHFVLCSSGRENVVSHLISTQCWSFANQNKSFPLLQTLRLSFFCKTFYFISQIFFFIRDAVFFVSIFFKRASGLLQGFRYYWNKISYRQNRQK